MRIVFRQGMSRDMTDMLLTDMQNAITEFEKLEYPTQTRVAQNKQQRWSARSSRIPMSRQVVSLRRENAGLSVRAARTDSLSLFVMHC